MIEILKMTKTFRLNKKDEKCALEPFSLRIEEGEVFGLLGPNGAGKTTTIKLLSTMISPTAGDARVNGWSIVTSPANVRSSIGVSVGDERSFYFRLSGFQNLQFFGAIRGLPQRELNNRILELLDRMNLTDAKNLMYMKYSSGMKRKLNLSRALLGDPPVYFLDEPTSGVDPHSARDLRDIVRELKRRRKTVLITTHNMSEAEQLCERIAILNKGKIVVISTPKELSEKANRWRVDIWFLDGFLPYLERLKGKSLAREVTVEGNRCSLITSDKVALFGELFSSLNWTAQLIRDIKIVEPSLEDIFVEYTEAGA